jgi:hypothetical protein
MIASGETFVASYLSRSQPTSFDVSFSTAISGLSVIDGRTQSKSPATLPRFLTSRDPPAAVFCRAPLDSDFGRFYKV